MCQCVTGGLVRADGCLLGPEVTQPYQSLVLQTAHDVYLQDDREREREREREGEDPFSLVPHPLGKENGEEHE